MTLLEEMNLGAGCLNSIIDYLGLATDSTNNGQFVLSEYRIMDRMRLDMAALRALNAFPTGHGGDSGDSLCSLIDKCMTLGGSRLLANWISQPLQSVQEIMNRLDIVEYLNKYSSEIRDKLRTNYLRRLPDIQILINKLYKVNRGKKHRTTLEDCVKIYQLANTIESLSNFLSESEESKEEPFNTLFTSKISSCIPDFKKLSTVIEESIDIASAETNEYIINPNYSPELTSIKEKIDSNIELIREEWKTVINNLGGVNVKSHFGLKDGHFFEVTKKDAASLENKCYKIIQMKKGGTTFTTATLQQLNMEAEYLKKEYFEEQKGLEASVLWVVAGYYPILESINYTIAQLDILSGFSTMGESESPVYVRPIIEEGGDLVIRKGRHPLIQHVRQCIPNDCVMGKEGPRMCIITGPNMGGKSTYIRHVGVIVLLAHIGCFVPCESARIPRVDSIIARVGASDHQLRGVSTFMNEMLEVSGMLKSATKNSLILIDELGRGTSTQDGIGLAWAIGEYLITEISSYTLFATHFHEITGLTNDYPKEVKNLQMLVEFGEQELRMTHVVADGVCDKSYGIEVAKKLGFPDEIIEMAQNLLEELENASSK